MSHFKSDRMVAVGIAVGALTVAYVWSAPGTLEPPAGPIEGTGHGLEELYNKIDAVQASQEAASALQGPWMYYYAEPTGNQSAHQVIAGPILLHAISYYNIGVGVFGGLTLADKVDQLRYSSTTVFYDPTVVYDIVLDDGLYLDLSSVAPGSSNVLVLYKPLSP